MMVADTHAVVTNTHMVITNTQAVVADTHTVVTNACTMLADIHQNAFAGQEGTSGKNHSVITTRYLPTTDCLSSPT